MQQSSHAGPGAQGRVQMSACLRWRLSAVPFTQSTARTPGLRGKHGAYFQKPEKEMVRKEIHRDGVELQEGCPGAWGSAQGRV